MVTFVGPPSGAIRNKPITEELKTVLRKAAEAAGIDTVRITSGGQDALGEGTRRTGSTRHDRGRAADLQLVVGSETLRFTDSSAPEKVLGFITAAAAHGSTGIGAGVTYMGDKTIHVGFGKSPSDNVKLSWGAQGSASTAPQWLRNACSAGWTSPAPAGGNGTAVLAAPGRFVVVARSGLKLRGGPGTDFMSERTLPAGTEVEVVRFDGPNSDWALVDLESDGERDGYLFAAFLMRADAIVGNEDAPEP